LKNLRFTGVRDVSIYKIYA